MRLTAVIFSLFLLVSGCQLTEPTYVEVPVSTLEAVARAVGSDLETALAQDREALREELSRRLGLQVDRIWETVSAQGATLTAIDGTTEAIHGTTREIVGVTAEIRPATDAAISKLAEAVMKDPTEPTSWLRGGIAGVGVLAAGLLGFRGARKRRKAGKVRERPTPRPPNSGSGVA